MVCLVIARPAQPDAAIHLDGLLRHPAMVGLLAMTNDATAGRWRPLVGGFRISEAEEQRQWALDGAAASGLSPRVSGKDHLQVACAIVERDRRVLAACRPRDKPQGGKWEFPGGKLHDGESPRDALVREIAEELSVAINVGAALPPATHDYGEFSITLLPFLCTIEAGEPVAVEHEALAWCAPDELAVLDWAAADVAVVTAYLAAKAHGGAGA